jgi:hypothetical protein
LIRVVQLAGVFASSLRAFGAWVLFVGSRFLFFVTASNGRAARQRGAGGRPMLVRESGTVATPYAYGPEFEVCSRPGGHARILAMQPITTTERDFKV